jgi:hypothetical protein
MPPHNPPALLSPPSRRPPASALLALLPVQVWSRLLQYIIPLYDGMGAQLMVISQMMFEVFKFAIPGAILLSGVSFTIFGIFQ